MARRTSGVTKKVTWAASLGDRSENADYQYNKKRLREIDRRVRYLTKCLEQLKIVDYSPQQEGKVFFRRVGEIETMRARRSASGLSATMKSLAATTTSPFDSPMARALLKKEVGDFSYREHPRGRGGLVRERN